MLNITSGKIDRALKVVVYGSEGIGKTTFAAAFPEPLFIDTEGGTAHMDVRRIDRPQSWDELLSIVEEGASDLSHHIGGAGAGLHGVPLLQRHVQIQSGPAGAPGLCGHGGAGLLPHDAPHLSHDHRL